MSEDQIVRILERISVLETEQKLQWSNHKEQSDEKWSMINKKLDKINSLPCVDHIHEIKSHGESIEQIKRWGFILFVSILSLHAFNPELISIILKIILK
jgi:hypothetical protein